MKLLRTARLKPRNLRKRRMIVKKKAKRRAKVRVRSLVVVRNQLRKLKQKNLKLMLHLINLRVKTRNQKKPQKRNLLPKRPRVKRKPQAKNLKTLRKSQ